MAKKLIKESELSEKELLELVYIYPEWQVGISYSEGDLVEFKGLLYEVVQDHTSQADWKPDGAESLYKVKTPEGVIPDWTKPTGSHDAYDAGDLVVYEGEVYESAMDGNVWSPSEYPEGWELVE